MSNASRSCRVGMAAFLFLVAASAVSSAAYTHSGRAEQDDDEEIFKQAAMLRAQGRHDDAIKLLKEHVDKVERQEGPDSPGTASMLSALGYAYAEAGQYDAAASTLRKALAIIKSQPELPARFRLNVQNNLLEVLVKLAKTEEAILLSRETLASAEAVLGPADDRTNLIRATLSKLLLTAKQFDEAISIARRVLEFVEGRHGAEDPETIPERTTLAVALMETGKYEEAKRLLEASLAIAQRRLPPEHEYTTATKNYLSNVLQLMGRTAEAAGPAAEATKGIAARRGARPADRALALNSAAQQAQVAGQYEAAEKLYLEGIENSRSGRPDHPETAAILANLSGLYSLWGRFADAERRAAESLAITSKNPGPGTIAEAKGKGTLAMIYFKTGRYTEAVPLLEAAYQTLRARLGPDHLDTAYVRSNLAAVAFAMNDFRRAAELGEAALADVERRGLGEHRNVGMILVNLGSANLGLRKFSQAEPLLRRAVAIFEKEPGPPSIDAATASNALAGLFQLTGRLDEAESVFRRTIETCRASLGADHPETCNVTDNLAALLAARGRWGEAADELERSRKDRRSFLDRTLPAMTENDQYRLLEMGELMSRNVAMSMALERRSEPGVAARSAEWVLNSKAVTVRALAQRAILARDADNPEAARIFAELDAVRGRLAQMALAREDPDRRSAGSEASYKLLDDRERELSHQLNLALRKPAAVAPWAGLREVRDALPPDSVLVEFVRVQVIDPALVAGRWAWHSPRYAAWVISPAGGPDVALVDLGTATDMERAVADFFRNLQPEAERRPGASGEAEAERRILEPLGVLSDRILKPLKRHLGPVRRWVLSPDGALWLVPWAALPEGEGRYTVEGHLIHLTVTGADLLGRPTATEAGAPAILADPDYNLAPGRALAKAQELGRARGIAPPSSARRGRIGSAALPDTFPRLPGTAAEATAIAPLMAAFTGTAPEVFVGAAASESVFKSLRSPKALVLSTHGFFLNSPEVADDGRVPSPGSDVAPANPLLRCGLILAGYNRAPAVATDDPDDGLVTGLEVAGSDLRGTDLVVLSACETALGQLRAGEGVAGLRQVFQLAGARAVVASIWKVPDIESYQLMSACFQGLARGRGGATALRDAQLALIADRRRRLGAANPYFWAAFSLTGFPGPAWRDEALTSAHSAELPSISRTMDRADDPLRPSSGAMISPVTGRPDPAGGWPDVALTTVLGVAGGYAARWWWRRGGRVVAGERG